MAETSLFWAGNTVGDAATVTDDAFSDWLAAFITYDRATMGVLDTGRAGFLGGLIVTGGAGSVSVATGIALVDGKPYYNSAAVSVAIATPAALTRIDRIVLRKDFALQTVRITRIAGVEGGAAPAIVQIDGTTWDIKLAQVSITTAGVIVVTNEAVAIRNPGGPGYQYSALASDDTAFTAGAYNSIGAGVVLTLGPGKWMIFAGAIGMVGNAGNIGIRLRNTTVGSTYKQADQYVTVTGRNWQLSTAPHVVDLASIQAVELQYIAIDNADTVYSVGTAMSAIRVI